MALAPHSVRRAPARSLSRSAAAALSPARARVFSKVTEIGAKTKQDLCLLTAERSQTGREGGSDTG